MKTLHFGTRSERISRVYYDLVWRDGCVDVVLIHTPEPGYACVLWGNDRLLTLVFGQILSQVDVAYQYLSFFLEDDEELRVVR